MTEQKPEYTLSQLITAMEKWVDELQHQGTQVESAIWELRAEQRSNDTAFMLCLAIDNWLVDHLSETEAVEQAINLLSLVMKSMPAKKIGVEKL